MFSPSYSQLENKSTFTRFTCDANVTLSPYEKNKPCSLYSTYILPNGRHSIDLSDIPSHGRLLACHNNGVRRGIRVIPCCLYKPMKRRKTIKDKARRTWYHLTPSIVHMPLYRYICLHNLICSFIGF